MAEQGLVDELAAMRGNGPIAIGPENIRMFAVTVAAEQSFVTTEELIERAKAIERYILGK